MKRSPAGRSTAAIATLTLALVLGACGSDDDDEPKGQSLDVPKVDAPTKLLNDGTIKLGASLTYPPLGYIDDDGNQAGLDPELSDAVAAQFGLKKVMTNDKFASLIPSLQAGQVDALFSSIFITRERAEAVDFIPYFETGQAFLVQTDSDFSPQSADDLCGSTVAVLAGSVNEQIANEDIKTACEAAGDSLDVRSFPTDPEATLEVTSGRADVLFTDRAVAVYRANTSDSGDLKVSSKEILYPIAVGIAVRKGDDEMRAAFQEAIDKLDESGQLEDYLDKYGLEPVTDEVLQESLEN